MAKKRSPEIVTLSAGELEQLLSELRAALSSSTYHLVEGLLRTLQWLLGEIEAKKASIRRLKKMIFGEKTEKTSKLFPQKPDPPSTGQKVGERKKRKGHGRKGAKDYPGAKRIWVAHPQLKTGSVCPKCLEGKLYRLKAPARIIRIEAQPIFSACIHELERLRCTLCGAVLTAPAPAEAGLSKYSPSVGVMLAIMRYGAGLPMHRMDKWQTHFGVPLAASTQWELIVESSQAPQLVYESLTNVAAQGQVVHNDDTTMRVQSLRKEIAAGREGERTGIFTTAIIARLGERQIALFFTGRNHAGENLDRVLKERAAELSLPLQMSDALSRNEAQKARTISCHCLLHGRRNFIEVMENFPEECRKVVESLREVYRWDGLAKKNKLSDLARLILHQENSRPIMEKLHQWMSDQLEEKRVEPNSGLGQAIGYMLKYWERLTRFLNVLGAPLDNNIAERALKTAILHRKNSLAYKTLRGAQVGDIFMSLIHTCQLNGVNPFEYLMALQANASEVAKNPAQWLPWNYRSALEDLNASCSPGPPGLDGQCGA